MNYHITCEHCGVWLSDHDHEHLARECYPKQIKALEDAAHAQMTTILATSAVMWRASRSARTITCSAFVT